MITLLVRIMHLAALLLLVAGCSRPAAPEDAAYRVQLETQPSPIQSGRLTTVTLRIADGTGKPLSGAKVSFKADHTGMSMGGSGLTATDEAQPGVYRGSFVPQMGGTYRLTVTIDGPQGTSEQTLEAQVQ